MSDQQKTDMDHAELGRLAEAKQSWSLGVYKNREHAADVAKFNSLDIPATVLALLSDNAALKKRADEAEDENTRWALRFADIREAAGMGHKPMLSEVPDAIRAMRAERDEAVGLLREIDEVPYTGPEWPKNRARTFLQSLARETGK